MKLNNFFKPPEGVTFEPFDEPKKLFVKNANEAGGGKQHLLINLKKML